MSSWKAGLLALMIPTALAAPVMAQEGGPGGPGGPRFMFSELDADGDGAITLEELQAAGPSRFASADADGDGVLTRDELLAEGHARVEAFVDRMLDRADADGDGSLTLAEIEDARDEGRGRRGPDPERMFGRLDADGDGAVTEAEFDEAMARFMERMGRRHGGQGGHGWFGGDRG